MEQHTSKDNKPRSSASKKRVADVMTENPQCATEQDTLEQAAKMMADHDCGAIPVVDSKGSRKVIGMITDRDITIRAVARGKNGSTKVADAMTRKVHTVHENDPLDKVFKVMSEAKVRRVPVVNSAGEILGIVAIADVAETDQDQKLADAVEEISERGGGQK